MIRDQIVAEARSWLGTRWHDQADIKGAGVDCAMLLCRVFVDLGLVPPFDPRPYPRHHYLHRGDELFLGWVQKYGRQVNSPLPGDVALFSFGRTVGHGAIVVDHGLIIHAWETTGRVELTEIRSLEERLHSFWSVLPEGQ
jgi:cell wall-associated NlpC family hydrolase